MLGKNFLKAREKRRHERTKGRQSDGAIERMKEKMEVWKDEKMLVVSF